MRDPKNLQVFHMADRLALLVYHETRCFPKEELFGLVSQMRRCAVSIPSNIVEGCSRDSLTEYLRFVYIAYGSSKELQYQTSLAARLGYMEKADVLQGACDEMSMALSGLIKGIQQEAAKKTK